MDWIIAGIIILGYIFLLAIFNVASKEDDDLEELFRNHYEDGNDGH